MKRNLPVILLLILVLLPSCLKGDFSASAYSFERSITVLDGNPTDTLKLKVELSDADASYTYKVSSPGDLLTWEGKLYAEGSDFASDILQITPGALMPEGEYKVYIYSDAGGSKDFSLTVAAVEAFQTSDTYEGEGTILFMDNQGNILENKEGSVSASFNYYDRYKNHVFVIENL